MKRTLKLTREALTPLTGAELADVQAAESIPTLLWVCDAIAVSSPIRCLTRGTTCINCE